MTPLLLASLVRAQVNQEIYSETDLLAIDSEVQEVREPGPAFAVLPPPGFQAPSQSSGAAPAAGIQYSLRQMVCSKVIRIREPIFRPGGC